MFFDPALWISLARRQIGLGGAHRLRYPGPGK
jgi:hypothetical protein